MIKTSFGIVRGEVGSLRALPLGEAEKKMSYRGQTISSSFATKSSTNPLTTSPRA